MCRLHALFNKMGSCLLLASLTLTTMALRPGIPVLQQQVHDKAIPTPQSFQPPTTHPGQDCLVDDVPPPRCEDYVDPTSGQAVYVPHPTNCSRFWECGPHLEHCLFECAPIAPVLQMGCCLYFDVRIQFPDGPVCNWPWEIDCAACSTDEQCWDGSCSFCDLTSHTCVIPDCCADADCERCNNCSLIDHTCSADECCTNSDCPPDYHCNDAHECVACSTDEDCCEHQTDDSCRCSTNSCFWCDLAPEPNKCTPGCSINADCPHNKPICNAAHVCIECNIDDDCPTTSPFCNTDDHTCNPCQYDDQCCSHASDINACPCASNLCQWCDVGIMCKPGCSIHEDCPINTPICGEAHICVECNVDADCPLSLPLCNTNDHTCIACRNDEECCSHANDLNSCPCSSSLCQWCDVNANPEACKPGCSIDEDCVGLQTCDVISHECVGCNEDSECSGDCEHCSLLGTCVPWECCTAADCGDPDDFVCADHVCKPVVCRSDEDCCSHAGNDDACPCDDKCQWCDDSTVIGECKPGCSINPDCIVAGQICNSDHHCSTPGAIILEEIRITTDHCTGCDPNNEAVELYFEGNKGPKNNCTAPLDRKNQNDFSGSNLVATFSTKEEMGPCYGFEPVYADVGGRVTWKGASAWLPTEFRFHFNPDSSWLDICCTLAGSGPLQPNVPTIFQECSEDLCAA